MVTDANIWIDLLAAGLEGRLLALFAQLLIPNLVFVELLEDGAALKTLGLRVQSLDGDQVERIVDLARTYPACSRPDLSTIVIAADWGLPLLTGDAALRGAAESEGLEVHGVLWVLDRLVETELITLAEARVGLDRILAAGARLPAGEVGRRWNAWNRRQN